MMIVAQHPTEPFTTFDCADNLASTTTTYTYDAANQMTSSEDPSGTTTYEYDGAGNQTKITDPASVVTTNTWSGQNRLTKVETGGTTMMTAEYNADGLRTKKVDASGTRKFIWDGQTLLMEKDENDVTQVTYNHRPGRYGDLISQKRGAGTSSSEWFHYDALGSTVNITDANEFVPETYDYDAWGKRLSSNSYVPPFLYVGRLGYYYDSATSDYYVRARTYSPVQARWLSRDPIGFRGGLNLYQYVGNSPMFFVDPFGLARQTDTAYEDARGLTGALGETMKTVDGVHRQSFSAKNCPCEIKFTFDKAYKGHYDWKRKNADPLTIYGVYVKISIRLEDEVTRGNRRHCCCDEIKILQVVRSTEGESRTTADPNPTGNPDLEYRRVRSGWNSAGASSRGWRVDTYGSYTDPYFTYTAERDLASGNTGSNIPLIANDPAELWDAPGQPSRIAVGKGKEYFSCAVCTAGNVPVRLPHLMACVKWGYHVGGLEADQIRFTNPQAKCGNHADLQPVRDAAARWDEIENNTDIGLV